MIPTTTAMDKAWEMGRCSRCLHKASKANDPEEMGNKWEIFICCLWERCSENPSPPLQQDRNLFAPTPALWKEIRIREEQTRAHESTECWGQNVNVLQGTLMAFRMCCLAPWNADDRMLSDPKMCAWSCAEEGKSWLGDWQYKKI